MRELYAVAGGTGKSIIGFVSRVPTLGAFCHVRDGTKRHDPVKESSYRQRTIDLSLFANNKDAKK